MKIQKEKLIRGLFYTFFGIFTFMIFLLITFPFNLLEKQVLHRLETESGCIVTIQESRYALPISLSWNNIQIKCPKRILGSRAAGMLTLKLQSFDVDLSLLPLLFKQEAAFDFEIRSTFGIIPGHLTIQQKEEKMALALHAEGKEITITEEGLSGILSFNAESQWKNQDILKGSGNLSFKIQKGKMKEFAGTPLPIGEIMFTNIKGKIFWKEGRAVIEQFSAQGDTADIHSESGTILLRNPPENSLLTFSLQATPKGALKEMAQLFIQGYNGNGPLKIRMSGPARAPKLAMNGKTMGLGF